MASEWGEIYEIIISKSTNGINNVNIDDDSARGDIELFIQARYGVNEQPERHRGSSGWRWYEVMRLTNFAATGELAAQKLACLRASSGNFCKYRKAMRQ
jgi:hypothetical protein